MISRGQSRCETLRDEYLVVRDRRELRSAPLNEMPCAFLVRSRLHHDVHEVLAGKIAVEIRSIPLRPSPNDNRRSLQYHGGNKHQDQKKPRSWTNGTGTVFSRGGALGNINPRGSTNENGNGSGTPPVNFSFFFYFAGDRDISEFSRSGYLIQEHQAAKIRTA